MNANDIRVPIQNFHKVTDWLYRGAEPTAEGLASLSALEVKTVIDLRWRMAARLQERDTVVSLGMQSYNIPLNYWTLPTRQDIDQFIEILDDENLRPIFVHCVHGADRTGVLIAMFRIVRCGWTLKEAYREMVDCGHHRFATWHFRLRLCRLAEQVIRDNR